jgi:phage baseplate assembly protein gpV
VGVHAGGPRSPTSDMSLCGVYYGIVTQNKDESEIARVKVRFPWLPEGDRDQSHWAHIAVPMAGKEYGTFTLPEVDDEVAVVFLAGDIRHPVVIGGLWNKTDTPPETNEHKKNDYRFIKSRSGHRLLFDDSSGKAKAVLTDKTNENYVGCGTFAAGTDSPNKLEISAPGAINGSPSKGVGVASLSGKLNLWCPNGKLEIKAMYAELTASDKAEIKAGGELKLEGGMQAVAVATGQGKFEGSKTKVGP